MILKKQKILTIAIIATIAIIITVIACINSTRTVQANNIMTSQRSSDDKAEIFVDYKAEELSVKAILDEVDVIVISYDNQTIKFEAKEAKMNLEGEGYHEIKVAFYKEGDNTIPCYEKKFAIVKAQEVTISENKKLEEFKKKMGTEFPLIEEKLVAVLPAEKTEIKIFNQLDGNLGSCLLIGKKDFKEEKVKKLSQEMLLKLAFPEVTDEKITRIEEILSE